MRGPQRLKKSETLELRLPLETKQAFMARCQAAGQTASEVLRSFIADYVGGRATAGAKRRRMWAPVRLGLAAGALAAAAVLAQPSLARASASAAFDRIDANHDGRVSYVEFSRAVEPKLSLAFGPEAPLAASGTIPKDLRERLIRQAFDRIDADRNGEISFSEFRRAYGS